MSFPSCPIPQVEEALRPYIRTREEVVQIRQTISNILQDKVGSNVTITQLTASSCISSTNDVSAVLQTDGLHKKFLEALAAHQRAQITYDQAKLDLEELRKSAKEDRLKEQPRDNGFIKAYVSSVRRQKQQDKLDVVQQALTKLNGLEPHPAQIDIKTVVKERLGPPPDAPQLGIDHSQMSSQTDELILALKKAVLQAKADLDTAKHDGEASRQRVEQLGNVPAAIRLSAFQSAREELIQWIESELVKVNDEEESLVHSDEEHSGMDYSQQEVQYQVQDLYDRYVSSRQSLVASVEAVANEAPIEKPMATKQETTSQSPGRVSQNRPVLTATQLLAFLPSLMQASRDEATLIQQTAFLRKHINVASSETKQTVQRLASESHLAPPDASSVVAWNKATKDNTDKTRAFVLEQVKSGEESISRAREALATLQTKHSAIQHLRGHA